MKYKIIHNLCLAPCAHCGSYDLSLSQENPYANIWFIGCTGCVDEDHWRNSTGSTRLEAQAEWNDSQATYVPSYASAGDDAQEYGDYVAECYYNVIEAPRHA